MPKVGEAIPVEKFWVSKTNMRADEPFGESEEDKALVEHFRRTSVVQPFKARPEGDGYGVVVGRRRFLAMREAGYKEFIVGKHVWVEEMTDEDAMDASLKENLEEFRKTPDPITRAEALNAYLSRYPMGIRGLARAWNMPHSTLADYLQILQLSQSMQGVVRKGLIPFSDGIVVLRLGLGEEAQNRLAELIETEGREAFKSELARLQAGRGKRGIPKDLYDILRISWDKRYKPDMELLAEIDRRAEAKGMKRDEWVKWYLRENIKA